MECQTVSPSVELIAPLGGHLKELYLSDGERTLLKEQAREFPSWDLTPPQLCDTEMLLSGGFSPLAGFMCRADYDSVVERMRLADGTLWPTPITLEVSDAFVDAVIPGQRVALRDPEGVLVAVLEVAEIWSPASICVASGPVGAIGERRTLVCLGGLLFGIEPPSHYDFRSLREGPRQVRDRLARYGRRRVAAFQTGELMHRAQVEWTQRAMARLEASLLIQPVMEACSPAGREYFARVRCYEHVLRHYPARTALLNLLPAAAARPGDRALVHRAIVARNFGCTHIILDPESGSDDGRALLQECCGELEVALLENSLAGQSPVPVKADDDEHAPVRIDNANEMTFTLSAGEVARRLRAGHAIPDGYTYPELLSELSQLYPPRHAQGFAIFFTGLSGSGKSTLAHAVAGKLLQIDRRQVTLLDGDQVRKHLSSELGFSKAHRDLNILRIGFVASEIAKHGGIAICAPIAPYAEIRDRVRRMVEPVGGFVEIHVATTLAVCERRDRKGLYAKARAGLLKGFTGVDDPYEVPLSPEWRIDTALCSPGEAADGVVETLARLGYIRPSSMKSGEPETFRFIDLDSRGALGG